MGSIQSLEFAWPGAGSLEQAEQWTREELRRRAIEPAGPPEQRRATPWSSVLAFPTSAGLVYFKACSPALAHEPAVIVPGGGWAAQPGQLDAARSRGYFVYLKARPEIASRRAEEAAGTRPVIMGEDPVVQMRTLFNERDPYYAKADVTVQTEAKSAEKVAEEIIRLAQTSAGW